MSLPVYVDAYAGYNQMNVRANSYSTKTSMRSLLCSISGTNLQPPTSKVLSTEGKTYLLRYDEQADEWTLQSGFDGTELLARPSIEMITVDAGVIRRAEKEIESCEYCHPDDAQIPFDWLLAEVSGRRDAVEFILSETALSELQAADNRKDLGRSKGLVVFNR